MKNAVSVSTNTYHGFSVDEALEGIARAGFRYVELTAVRGWTEHIMPDQDEAQLLHVEDKLRELGLECIGLSGHCNLTDAGRLNDFRANMALAHRFGAKWIISSTGEAHFGKEERFTDDVLIENIKALVPDLEKYDLKLGIEVHGEYGTGEKIYNVVKGVGSDRVGINYDTANVVFYGGKVPNEEVKTCFEGVNYVHLKDKVGLDNGWNFPAVGAGDLDLIGFLGFMEGKGYEGPVSIEVEFTADYTMNPKKPGDLEIADKAVKDSFEYLHAHGVV